jgi:hypothetical protein
MTTDERAHGGTIEALLEAEKVFLSDTSTETQKSYAIKFIIHFIGDIHQPLHTGRPEDQGGNKVPKKWHGNQTNLHAVWDSYLISEAYQKNLWDYDNNDKTISEEDYADYLLEKFDGVSFPVLNGDFEAWLRESMSYRDAAYRYKDETEKEYTRRFIGVVDSRIYKAGVRLAATLKMLLNGVGPTDAQMNLRRAIERITGPLKNIIFLRPKSQQHLIKDCTAQENCEKQGKMDPLTTWIRM